MKGAKVTLKQTDREGPQRHRGKLLVKTINLVACLAGLVAASADAATVKKVKKKFLSS